MRHSYRYSNPEPDFISMLMEAFFSSGDQAQLHPLTFLSTEEQVFAAMSTLLHAYRLCAEIDGVYPQMPLNIKSIDDAYNFRCNWSPQANIRVPPGHPGRWTSRNDYVVFYPFSLFGEEVDDQYTSGSNTRPMRSFGLRNEFHLRKIAAAIADSVKALDRAYFDDTGTKRRNSGGPLSAIFWSNLLES